MLLWKATVGRLDPARGLQTLEQLESVRVSLPRSDWSVKLHFITDQSDPCLVMDGGPTRDRIRLYFLWMGV